MADKLHRSKTGTPQSDETQKSIQQFDLPNRTCDVAKKSFKRSATKSAAWKRRWDILEDNPPYIMGKSIVVDFPLS